jgi:hypothetical protein
MFIHRTWKGFEFDENKSTPSRDKLLLKIALMREESIDRVCQHMDIDDRANKRERERSRFLIIDFLPRR